MIGVR
jgi:hypothetical protein